MKIYSDNVFDWATCQLESAIEHAYFGSVMQAKGIFGQHIPSPGDLFHHPNAPATPDPNQVSQQQIQANQDNQAYNNAANHGNTYTPLGSSTYKGHVDPTTGAMVYDQTVSLDPTQQKLLDLQNAQSLHLGQTGNNLLGQIDANSKLPALKSSYSWNDLNTARQQVQDALYKRQSAYLDPQYQQRQSALETQLANQGIVKGSEAWNSSMQNFGMDRSRDYGQARDSAIIGSSGEMDANARAAGDQLSQQMALRNMPLNQFNALRASSQVNIPQFGSAPNAQSANTDTAGNAWNAYSGNLGAWNANVQSQDSRNNAIIGAIGSAAGK
jgi:hypothetical protein